MPAAFLLPDHIAIPADFKNPSAPADQVDFQSGGFFNFSRHPVGFRTVVSLLAILDLDLHGLIIDHIPRSANQFSRDPFHPALLRSLQETKSFLSWRPMIRLLLFAFFLSYLTAPLRAHKIDAMEFEFQATEESWILKGDTDVSYLLPEFRNDIDEPPLRRYPLMHETSPAEWQAYLDQMEATLDRLITFKFNGEEIPHTYHYPGFSIENPVLPEDPDGIAFIHLQIKVEPIDDEGELRLAWNDDQNAELIVVVDPRKEVIPLSALSGESVPLLKREGGRTENPDESPLWSWLVSGFHHVVPLGLDHLLFIVGIFLAAPRLGPILGQSLLFTLAHSITLTCAVMGWLNFPTTYIEIIIAASIAWIGVENLFIKKVGRNRILLVFGFGLIHGLGFASVLGDQLENIPRDKQVLPLIGFNIGVEIAQVAVLIVAYFLVRPFKQHLKKIQIIGSLLIAAAGIFWMVERIGSLS